MDLLLFDNNNASRLPKSNLRHLPRRDQAGIALWWSSFRRGQTSIAPWLLLRITSSLNTALHYGLCAVIACFFLAIPASARSVSECTKFANTAKCTKVKSLHRNSLRKRPRYSKRSLHIPQLSGRRRSIKRSFHKIRNCPYWMRKYMICRAFRSRTVLPSLPTALISPPNPETVLVITAIGLPAIDGVPPVVILQEEQRRMRSRKDLDEYFSRRAQ
jgi:hypothetical protein